MIYKQGMRVMLSDPWAFWMDHKQDSSVQATKGAELGAYGWKRQCSSSWQGQTTQGANPAQVSPVAQQCWGEAQYPFTSTPQLWMLSGLYPNPSKDKVQLHSTSPIDNVCCGKCHWMDVNHLVDRWFSIWTWTILHGGQNCMGRMSWAGWQERACCSL